MLFADCNIVQFGRSCNCVVIQVDCEKGFYLNYSDCVSLTRCESVAVSSVYRKTSNINDLEVLRYYSEWSISV